MFIDAVLECLGVRWKLHGSFLSSSDTLIELYTNSKRQQDVERAGMGLNSSRINAFKKKLFCFCFGVLFCTEVEKDVQLSVLKMHYICIVLKHI